MARFFVKSGSNEKVAESPPPDVANLSGEEGLVDEDHDDLHRGMKPRQLSAWPKYTGGNQKGAY